MNISGINFYNYSKTPSRGLKDFEVFLDDNLIWKGFLKRPTGPNDNKTSIILSQVGQKNPNLANTFFDNTKHHVSLTNEGQLCTPQEKATTMNARKFNDEDLTFRPQTGANFYKKN